MVYLQITLSICYKLFTFWQNIPEAISLLYSKELVENALEQSPHVKFAVFDHITSPTSLVLPVKRLVRICRKHSVRVLIDGAHACGQVPLNLNDIDCDYYVGMF